MIELTGKRAIYQSSRLFEPLLALMVTFDALMIATECMKTGVLDRSPGNIGIEAHQFSKWIRFSALLPTQAMTRNAKPSGFEFIFSNNEGNKGAELGPVMFGYATMTMAITAALYVQFYERHADWIKKEYGGDTKSWLPLFNFARAIRNFIVHHEGRVHFDNPKAAPVIWHHLTYSPADEGKQAVGHNFISVGDLIVLLIEFGDALDAEGCPFPI